MKNEKPIPNGTGASSHPHARGLAATRPVAAFLRARRSVRGRVRIVLCVSMATAIAYGLAIYAMFSAERWFAVPDSARAGIAIGLLAFMCALMALSIAARIRDRLASR